MNQRPIVISFPWKGFTAMEMAMAIHTEFVVTLGAEAVGHQSVIGDLREPKFSLSTHPPPFFRAAPSTR
jgi:hypothetical protein